MLSNQPIRSKLRYQLHADWLREAMSEDLSDVPSRGDQAVDLAEYIRILENRIKGLHQANDSFGDLIARAEAAEARAESWRERFNSEAGLAGKRQLEAEEWRDTARSEMAGRRAAEAEVERLKGLFISTCESRDAWIKQCDKAEAEVSRLRAALEQIETADGGICESGYSAGYEARAALRGGGE